MAPASPTAQPSDGDSISMPKRLVAARLRVAGPPALPGPAGHGTRRGQEHAGGAGVLRDAQRRDENEQGEEAVAETGRVHSTSTGRHASSLEDTGIFSRIILLFRRQRKWQQIKQQATEWGRGEFVPVAYE